ncbi:MAG: NAD(P)H-binding protein [Pseudomonadota bacterium]
MTDSLPLAGQKIVLTGATGRLGGAVVPALLGAGADVTAIVRRADRARLDARAAQTQAALTDENALAAALAGADQLVAILPDVPEIPQMMATLLAAARSAGIKRIVKISAHLASQTPPESFGIEHKAADELVEQSGLDAVIYRPAMFMQSLALFFGDWAKGRMIVPVKDGKVAFIDASDIAAAVVKALEGSVKPGIYTLTGPQSLRFADIAQMLSTWSGAPMKHTAPPLWLAGLIMRTDKTIDGFTRDRLLGLLKALQQGKEAPVLPDLGQILGRPALTFEDRLAQCGAYNGAPPQLI